MQAQSFNILGKARTGGGMVGPADFVLGEGSPADPSVVLRQPNLTLYCLDTEKRQVLFVETPAEVDLPAAPFFYDAQYQNAHRVVSLPYEALHALAGEAPFDPARLVLIFSIGRCGSTLVSRVFAETESVYSLSEPDVFTQMLGIWGVDRLHDPELAALIRSCTRLQAVPGRHLEATATVLKFRSEVTHMGHVICSVFPEAKVVYLYRQAEPWARSFARLFRLTDPLEERPVSHSRIMYGRTFASIAARNTISGVESLAAIWSSNMKQALAMRQSGIPMFVARYEELLSDPRSVLSAMFAHCDIPLLPHERMDAVLERDSQEGSALSRASLSSSSARLSAEHIERLRRLIPEFAPGLNAEVVIPGTFFPACLRRGEVG